jgi:hypothetical protein
MLSGYFNAAAMFVSGPREHSDASAQGLHPSILFGREVGHFFPYINYCPGALPIVCNLCKLMQPREAVVNKSTLVFRLILIN